MRTRFALAGFFLVCFVVLSGFKIDLKGIKAKIEQSKQQKTAPAPGATAPAREPAATAGVCNASGTNGFCYAFTGPKNNDDKTKKGNQMACRMLKGQFAPNGECPVPNRLGRCAIAAGTPEEYHLVYYAGKSLDTVKASNDCANPKSGMHRHGAGAWTAGG